MLVHFINNYNVVGRVGDKIRIRGDFPGISKEDMVFLNDLDNEEDEAQPFKIEHIEYHSDRPNYFNAVVAME